MFVTTKLFNNEHGYDAARRAFDRSLGRLGLDYVDLYLIHWPVQGERMNSWRALEEIVASGRCRAIGVSNYMERHLTEVYEHSGVWPAVNQFELHPFLQQPELVAFHEKHGIAMEAYCPVVRAQRADDPVIGAIAAEVGKSWAQVMIRWSLQRGFICIPKSSNPDRIRQNADVFDFVLSGGSDGSDRCARRGVSDRVESGGGAVGVW